MHLTSFLRSTVSIRTFLFAAVAHAQVPDTCNTRSSSSSSPASQDCSTMVSRIIICDASWTINQSINQSIHQPIHLPINQSINQSKPLLSVISWFVFSRPVMKTTNPLGRCMSSPPRTLTAMTFRWKSTSKPAEFLEISKKGSSILPCVRFSLLRLQGESFDHRQCGVQVWIHQ